MSGSYADNDFFMRQLCVLRDNISVQSQYLILTAPVWAHEIWSLQTNILTKFVRNKKNQIKISRREEIEVMCDLYL
jgi:hypothetical protein